MKVRSLIPGLLATAALCLSHLVSFSPTARGADTNSEPATVTAVTNVVSAMNPSDVEELRTKLDALQRANDLALGRWSALLDQNNALSNVLVNLQQSLEEQRRREVQLSEESRAFSGRVMFGAGAAIFLVFLASYWFQLRCLNRVMEVTRATHELPAPFAPALLEAAKEAANTRESKLLEAIKLLEDRIRRFEMPANGAAPTPVAASARANPTPAMIVSGPNQPVFKGTMENGHGHAAPEAKPSEAVPVAGEPAPAETQPASEVSVLLAKGEILLEAERMQEAVNVFNEALALDPNNAEAHLKKGIGLERLNRLELALTSYNEALRINPKRSFAYVYKARVLAALHRYDEALVVYDMALGKTKSNTNGEAAEVNRTKAGV